ncbi:hypothetical protein C7974DRAFT_235153 [Boeremia exigua]|uniref:uncharacterized protein n=1 Tax=Boeremia exigua TaxID=749465 RepID=UPI001E8EC849|nr:uncharacterized protein C7974DRAFT_235153 [Boeremia exigua]KAH6620489.1 hypothetical protein C7974DRAFT_235153 [Boeremia exigua]
MTSICQAGMANFYPSVFSSRSGFAWAHLDIYSLQCIQVKRSSDSAKTLVENPKESRWLYWMDTLYSHKEDLRTKDFVRKEQSLLLCRIIVKRNQMLSSLPALEKSCETCGGTSPEFWIRGSSTLGAVRCPTCPPPQIQSGDTSEPETRVRRTPVKRSANYDKARNLAKTLDTKEQSRLIKYIQHRKSAQRAEPREKAEQHDMNGSANYDKARSLAKELNTEEQSRLIQYIHHRKSVQRRKQLANAEPREKAEQHDMNESKYPKLGNVLLLTMLSRFSEGNFDQ